MKILHIIEGVDKNLGGLPAALFGILKLEKSLNINSEVLSVTPPNGTFNQDDFTQKFYLFPKTIPSRFTNSQPAIQWLNENIAKYDLVILHGLWNLLIYRSALIAIKHRLPYIIWPHGALVPYDLRKKRLLKLFLGNLFINKIIANAAFLCLTSKEEHNVTRVFGTHPPKIILPLPVNILIKGIIEDNNIIVNNAIFKFIFIGRLNYKKGIDIAIKAFKEVSEDFPFIQFDIWGTGDAGYSKYINNVIEECNVKDKVHLKGFLNSDAKMGAYNGADCFVLSSLYENFGISPIEALQGGLPLLISRGIYIWEDVKDAAWICNYDVKSVAEQMRIILTDKSLYNYKKSKAIETGNKYKEENLRAQFLEFYKKFNFARIS